MLASSLGEKIIFIPCFSETLFTMFFFKAGSVKKTFIRLIDSAKLQKL